jgi:hypothetical protein
MKLNLIQEANFTKGNITAGSLLSRDEWVLFFNNGQVVSYNARNKESALFFSLKSRNTYLKDPFDITSRSSVYAIDHFVVVVNDFKLHGYVYDRNKKHMVHLWREDYYARYTHFPIALFKNEAGIPHLIYAVDWNRLHIMNLETLQKLTATKSLIVEGAEEGATDYIKQHPENIKPWPSAYDYFYGELLLSPNGKKFLSKGQGQGSSHSYRVYDIEDFIRNPRIKEQVIGSWEHSIPAACWVDEQTIAMVCHPWHGEKDAGKNGLPLLHLYTLHDDGTSTVSKQFVLDAFDGTNGGLYFSGRLKAFIAFSITKGLTVADMDGGVLFRDETFVPDRFYPELALFLSFKDDHVWVHELVGP